jgi:hypothetical protein
MQAILFSCVYKEKPHHWKHLLLHIDYMSTIFYDK